jgi:hypothetical protein
VVFIESRVFTRRLNELAKARASEVLDAIQSDLLKNPMAAVWFRVSAAFARPVQPIPIEAKASAVDFAICI